MMNTAMKLMMMNNWVKMAPAEDDPMPTSAVDETVPEEEESAGGDDLDWLFEETSLEKEEEETPTVTEEETPEVDATEVPGKEEEKPTETPEVTEKTEEEEEEPTEEQPTSEELSPEKLAELKENYRAELEKQFAISDEDANLLVTAPEKVLPRLASQIAMQILEQAHVMQTQLVQNLPNIIRNTQLQVDGDEAIKQQFMSLNPELSDMKADELEAAINEFAPIIKNRFPRISVEERMKKLGLLIRNTYGIEAKAPAKQQEKKKAVPPKPHTPTAPARSSVPAGQQPRSQLQTEIDELLNSDD